ncbi:MAG: YbaN family protein [Phycisphaerales bacterium JB063]
MDRMDTTPPTTRARLLRLLLAGLSVICFVLGWVGLWVPGLPTTVFWIASCYLAAKSCPVIQRWIYARGAIGQSVRLIVEHRALTAAGKRRALLGMTLGIGLSIALLLLLGNPGPVLLGTLPAAGLLGAACIVFGLRTHRHEDRAH